MLLNGNLAQSLVCLFSLRVSQTTTHVAHHVTLICLQITVAGHSEVDR